MISIILPCYNSGEHLSKAVESILNTEYPFELILVESESTDGTAELCDKLSEQNDNIKVIHTKKEGITKAINKGILESGEKDIYLTQDDVILPNLYGRDWLTELVNISKLEDCGVVTTLNAGGTSNWEYLDGFNWVGTWSLFIPRKTLKLIGKLDEGFSPGPGDDIDYSYRVNKAGLKIYTANFWVDHHRQTENFNDKIEFTKRKNAGYFRKKHGFDYWEEFEFNDEKYLLYPITKKMGGCFKSDFQVESKNTALKIREITENFKENDIFLDVGANTGLMSLMCQGGIVYSFEPFLPTFNVLSKNLLINNKLKATLNSINSAIYDKKFNYNIQTNEGNWGENKIVEDPLGEYQTRTLDSFNFENVKLIKIDTEGCDNQVIKGAKNLIKRYNPIIITEEDCSKTLKELNYEKTGSVDNNTIYELK